MLPIFDKKSDILKAIREHDTVIISAETGSGKSTQVPQFLYEEGFKVIVTEPRRIAAISLAERVGQEMNSESAVGYQTAFEKRVTDDTRILFCTDGLQIAKGLKNFNNTILVLDEVHEWNLNIETLIAWIKRFREEGNSIKVVLMSATIDVKDIMDYFGDDAISIHASGRLYDVKKYHEPVRLDIQIIEEQVMNGKNILVFVPGKAEISQTIEPIYDHMLDCEVIPLHGELSSQEQRRCFAKYNRPKVIVATNIAQTSLTIPDIDVVIDSGLEKRIEVIDGIEGLYLRDISKADCLQRAGRAGRVKDGQYFLCSKNSIEDRDEYSIPEIQRLNLEKVVLKLASVGIDASTMEFIHQPQHDRIKDAKYVLEKLGALEKNNKVTSIGRRLVKIPVSVQYGRMIVEAEKYGSEVLEDVITIASICESGSLVDYRKKSEFDSGHSYDDFVEENQSDLLAELEIYKMIRAHKFENLQMSGINAKAFFRAKEFHDKMMVSLQNVVEFKDGEKSTRDTLIKCIVLSNMHDIYRYDYGDCYNSHKTLRASKNSAVVNSWNRPRYDFAVGKPITITYRDKWGDRCHMDILSMITCFTFDFIEPFLTEDDYQIEYDESNSSYDPVEDVFYIHTLKHFNQYKVNDEYTKVSRSEIKNLGENVKQSLMEKYEENKGRTVILNGKVYLLSWDGNLHNFEPSDMLKIGDDVEFKTIDGTPFRVLYQREYFNDITLLKKVITEKELDKYIEIGGNKYAVNETWEKRLYVEIPTHHFKDGSITETELFTKTGKRVLVYWGGKYYINPQEVARLINEKEERRRKEMEAHNREITLNSFAMKFPKSTTKVELLREGFQFLGEQTVEDIHFFVGLIKNKKSVGFKIFDTEEEANEETQNAMEFLVDKYIEKYPDKLFYEKRQGQKINTTKSIAAKGEFKNFVADVKKSVDTNTIGDSLMLIDEFYEEVTSELKRA